MKSVLKLGTRKSLLAIAQSQWVAHEVEKHNPGIQVELVGIETRGDRITDIPLSQIDGKEFFVAEIDSALKSGEVDFTVHSMKDLSLERPLAFVAGAIPKRENPRDVILFGPHALENLKRGRVLKIGTSSPRRLENIPPFLAEALPSFGHTPQFVFEEIRGNVNTRLSRVHQEQSSERYLDGVVLAFAGLIRLWRDPAGKNELQKLLKDCRWMVLPLTLCPAAPAQGALMVECRRDDQKVRDILGRIHHPETVSQVEAERAMLAQYGGGCHQRFGATELASDELGKILFLKGKSSKGEVLDETRWQGLAALPSLPSSESKIWNGHEWRSKSAASGPETVAAVLPTELKGKSVFVAHYRAVSSEAIREQLEGARIWVSGTMSWFKLAKMGLWVEGCAENLGFDPLMATLTEDVLGLSGIEYFTVLTHEMAAAEWQKTRIRVCPTYRAGTEYSKEAQTALSEATHVFWSSGSQYDELRKHVPKNIHHACGPGKTAQWLRRNGIVPTVFPSVKEWKLWLQVK